MKTVVWSKLDKGLRNIYMDWRAVMDPDAEGSEVNDIADYREPITIILEHDGNLSEAAAAEVGFAVESTLNDKAYQGAVLLDQVAALTQLPEVMLLTFGMRRSLKLANSIVNVGVASSASNLADGVWFYNPGGPGFTGNSGEGVVIGIIDTGIDWTHPCFKTVDDSETRIEAIWDQFLTPASGESSPASSLLAGLGGATPTTYGVEYNKTDLDSATAVLDVRHEDENGHGTHVAGIAAGNGAAESTLAVTPRTGNIGIAPEAKLIVVNSIHKGTSNIGPAIQERDAFQYIVNKAASLLNGPYPCVINGSFGTELHPHDGRGNEGNLHAENHLHTLFNGQAGRIGVLAAGNPGGESGHIKLTIPSGAATGQIDLPFTLVDNRSTRPRRSSLIIEVYYPSTANGVKAWIKLPGLSSFFGGDGVGTTSGTDLDEVYEGTFGAGLNIVRIFHNDSNAQSPYGNVTRRRITYEFHSRRRVFNLGDYEVRLQGPAGTVMQLYINTAEPDFRILFDRAQLPTSPEVSIESISTIDSPGQSPDVITVASYNINSGGSPFVVPSSGRGPLLNYAGGAPIAMKPNVAAPGANISSASNNSINRLLSAAANYVAFSGTSMAAPHISGLVALMLSKNGTLTRAQILQAFEDSIPSPGPALHHDPSPNYTVASYSVPTPPVQAGDDEAGLGLLNYRQVLAQVPNP